MTFPQTQVTDTPQSGAATIVMEAFDAIQHASVYGKRHDATSGLTWGYYGGRWGGNSIADGTLALTASQTNYVVVNRSTGAISVSTSATNWNDAATYARVYKLTTSTTAVTATEDHRSGPYGVHGQIAGGTAGRHSIWVAAAAIQPQSSDPCSILTTIAGSAGQPDVHALKFDQTTTEYAQFSLAMPKSWDEGTVTFEPIWRHAAATAYGVVWGLQAVAVGNDDAIGANYGTAQTSTDTGGTTGDLYRGPESSAITIAGTPAAEDVVFFRVYRDTGSGSDTLDVDADLLGIVLHITTAAETDA